MKRIDLGLMTVAAALLVLGLTACGRGGQPAESAPSSATAPTAMPPAPSDGDLPVGGAAPRGSNALVGEPDDALRPLSPPVSQVGFEREALSHPDGATPNAPYGHVLGIQYGAPATWEHYLWANTELSAAESACSVARLTPPLAWTPEAGNVHATFVKTCPGCGVMLAAERKGTNPILTNYVEMPGATSRVEFTIKLSSGAPQPCVLTFNTVGNAAEWRDLIVAAKDQPSAEIRFPMNSQRVWFTMTLPSVCLTAWDPKFEPCVLRSAG